MAFPQKVALATNDFSKPSTEPCTGHFLENEPIPTIIISI